MKKMPEIDAYEHEVLTAFEKNQLKSVATKAEMAKFKPVARTKAIRDRQTGAFRRATSHSMKGSRQMVNKPKQGARLRRNPDAVGQRRLAGLR